MIVVVTGMVGIDKKNYLQKVCDYANSKGKTTLLCNVGDMMYTEAPDIAPGKILYRCILGGSFYIELFD